jgi:hypothetical protein
MHAILILISVCGRRNAISSDTRALPAYRGGDVLSTVADVPGEADSHTNLLYSYSEQGAWKLSLELT